MLKDLPSDKLAKIADVLEIVSILFVYCVLWLFLSNDILSRQAKSGRNTAWLVVLSLFVCCWLCCVQCCETTWWLVFRRDVFLGCWLVVKYQELIAHFICVKHVAGCLLDVCMAVVLTSLRYFAHSWLTWKMRVFVMISVKPAECPYLAKSLTLRFSRTL